MKIALIDNYDSFTYNLFHQVKELGVDVDVKKNDSFSLKDLKVYDKFIFSPGPGLPKDAGLMEDVIRFYAGKKPMLGVCLGEQAIGEVFGARLLNLSQVYHGLQTSVHLIERDRLFKELPEDILVGRYHSWLVDQEDLPECLKITAVSEEGHIMALQHRIYNIYGIQFHPESILTPNGKQIISNFLNL